MNSELERFLNDKGLADPIRSAFIAYCKSLYSSRFMFRRNGDTIKIFLERMTQDQVEAAWLDFIRDLREVIPTITPH